MVHYSEAALYNKFYRGGWIEFCNNDCGKLVYYDVDTGQVKNATGTDADVLHKETCSEIAKLKEFARAINWYPNLAIDRDLDKVFDELEECMKTYDFSRLITACGALLDKIMEQRKINKDTKIKWDEKNRRKLISKQQQDEYAAKQVDQQSQYDVLIKDPEFRKRWHIE